MGLWQGWSEIPDEARHTRGREGVLTPLPKVGILQSGVDAQEVTIRAGYLEK